MAKFYSLRFGSGDPRTYTGLAPTFLIFVRMTDGATIAPPSIAESLASSGLYQFSFGTTQPISFLADAATTSPGTAGRYVAGQIDPADRADEFGTTLIAIGTTGAALGTTAVSWGSAIGSTLTATGSTLVGIGNTAISLGMTGVALGTTGVALGTTSIALGTTNVALGTTMIALGNTILALSGSGNSALVYIGSTASIIGDSSTSPVDLFGYLKRVREVLEGQQQFIKTTGALTMLDRTGATTLVSRTVSNNATLVTKV